MVIEVSAFTTVGPFEWAVPLGVSEVEVLVVAGGGGGFPGYENNAVPGGGGGAGGVIYMARYSVKGGTLMTGYVGAGGVGATVTTPIIATNGDDSTFGLLKAIGGGRGGQYTGRWSAGAGGSGGGNSSYAPKGAGTALQGHDGGASPGNTSGSGGGGGAGAVGESGSYPGIGGKGGAGVYIPNFSGFGASGWFAGGGGGGAFNNTTGAGVGGIGGGGNGGPNGRAAGLPGMANTGGGGGGGSTMASAGTWFKGGAGGSGVVLVRYDDAGISSTHSRIAGTVSIDTVAAARTVLIIKNDPGDPQVVASAQSGADGVFNIDYFGWTGGVIAVALDNHGSAFAASAPLNSGAVIHPTTPNGYVYMVTVSGITGSTEPTWNTTAPVISGSVTFNPRPYYRPIASGPLVGEVVTP